MNQKNIPALSNKTLKVSQVGPSKQVQKSKPESYKNFEVRTFNLHSSHLKQKRMKSYQWFWFLKWHHTWNDIFDWHNNDTSPEVHDVFYGHCTVGIVCINGTVVPTSLMGTWLLFTLE